MTNPDNVGGLPDGMVMVQRSDAMRLAMFVEPLLTGGAVQLSAMRIAELCRAAPADNAGGLIWYVCTSCMLMVQLPSDTPTLGRCQCSPKGWSLRRAKLPKGYELCRAAPAGGDDWPFLEEIGRDGKPTGYWVRKGSPAAARMCAPAGSGEVVVPAIERMLVDAYAAGMNGDNFDMLAARRNLSALLRKLQQGADYVMVPREPTDAMRVAGERERLSHPGNINPLTTWDAMIAASQDQEGVK